MTQVASMAGDTSAKNEAGGHGETLAPNPYVLSNAEGPLDRDELVAIDAWWRAANYLAVGQIYLSANPCCVSHYSPNTSSLGRWDISAQCPV